MYDTIEVHESGAVVTVSLNRPEVRNAFNARMIDELSAVFGAQADRRDVRAIVLRGNGASFSAGADASWMRASLTFSREENIDDARRMSTMFQLIDEIPHPVVAQVHGACLGGGMGLIATCDIVVAAQDTVFGFTETRLGLIPAVISRFVLPKIGPGWARALFTTGERFDADVARLIGLVHWVCPSDQLTAAVAEKVDHLRRAAPGAVRAAKSLIHQVRALEASEVPDFTAERIADLRAGTEGQEGLQALLEKRSPDWRDG